MALSDNLSLLLKIKGDSSDAVRAVNRVETAISGLGGVARSAGSGDIGGLVGSLANMTGGMGKTQLACIGALGAVAALGGAATGLTAYLFSLAEATAEFGSQIYDASVQTGLGAEALSTLKAEAEMADVEFSKIVTSINKFALLIAKAKDGSDEAIKSLNKLGINGKTAFEDIEGATAQVIKTISDTVNPIEKANLAAQAFGTRGGKDMIKVIEQMKGDLPAAIAEAKRLGYVLSEEAMRASDDFGDSVKKLSMQFEGMKRTIGTALMPVFLKAMKDMSDWFAKNKDGARDLGDSVASAVGKMLNGLIKLLNWVKENQSLFLVLLGAATGGAMGGPWGAAIGAFFGASAGLFISATDNPRADAEAAAKRGVPMEEMDKRTMQVAAQMMGVARLDNLNQMPPGMRKDFDQWAARVTAENTKNREANERGSQGPENASSGGSSSGRSRSGRGSRSGANPMDDLIRSLRGDVASYEIERDKIVDEAMQRMERTKISDGLFRLPTADEIAGAEEDARGAILAYYSNLFTAREQILKAEFAKIDSDPNKTQAEKDREKLNLQKEYDNESKRLGLEKNRALRDLEVESWDKQYKSRQEAYKRDLDALDRKLESEEEALKQSYEAKEISEKDFIEKSAALKMQRIDAELKQIKDSLDQGNMPADEYQKLLERQKELESARAQLVLQTNGAIVASDARTSAERLRILRETQDAVNRMALTDAETAVAEARSFYARTLDKKRGVQAVLDAELKLAAVKHQIRLDEIADAQRQEEEAAKNDKTRLEAIREKYRVIREEEQKTYRAEKKGAETSASEMATGSFYEMLGKSSMVDEATGKLEVIKGLSGSLKQAFDQMAQGLGSFIQQWVLTGEVGPAAMRKLTASILAGLAAQAAVEALMETARGIAALTNPFTAWKAPLHFKAAGIFAAVAGVAAVAGRAIAGDAFKEQSGKATGTSSRSTSGQGQAYSGSEAVTIDGSRNMTAPAFKPELVIKDKSGMFSQLFEAEIRNNSRVRSLIIDTANS